MALALEEILGERLDEGDPDCPINFSVGWSMLKFPRDYRTCGVATNLRAVFPCP